MNLKIPYLQTIQGIINRLANNSFLIKGWTITIVAAMIALTAKNWNRHYVLFALFPAIIFWVLDAYYLSNERRFKALYNHARHFDEEQVDFSLETKPFRDRSNSWFIAIISKTILLFYVSIIMTILMVFLLL